MNQTAMGSVDPYEEVWKAVMSPNKQLNLGPFLLGHLFDMALWGIMFNQFVQWSVRYSQRGNERLLNRIIVYWLTSYGTFFTVIGTRYIWFLFVENFGRYSPFASLQYIGWYPLMGVGVAVPSQLFYLDRAQTLSKTKWLPAVCILLIFATAIVNRVKMWNLPINEIDQSIHITYTWIATTVTVDLIITIRILWILVKKRSGEPSADRFITRLMRLSIESQLPPTILAIVFLIITGISPTSTIGPFIILMTSKVYIIPLFAVINSRRTIRRQMNLTVPTTITSEADTGEPLSSEPIETLDSAANGAPNELEMDANKEDLPYHTKEQQSL